MGTNIAFEESGIIACPSLSLTNPL